MSYSLQNVPSMWPSPVGLFKLKDKGLEWPGPVPLSSLATHSGAFLRPQERDEPVGWEASLGQKMCWSKLFSWEIII